MESTELHEIKTALTTLSQSLGSALMDLARQRADHWALSEAMKTGNPEMYANYERLRSSERFHNIVNAASFQVATISEIPDTLR